MLDQCGPYLWANLVRHLVLACSPWSCCLWAGGKAGLVPAYVSIWLWTCHPCADVYSTPSGEGREAAFVLLHVMELISLKSLQKGWPIVVRRVLENKLLEIERVFDSGHRLHFSAFPQGWRIYLAETSNCFGLGDSTVLLSTPHQIQACCFKWEMPSGAFILLLK